MEDLRSLGQFIATKRKRLHLTQEQLAVKMHVSKSAIGKWETDGGVPDRNNLYNLADDYVYQTLRIKDIMKTMDNRIKIDQNTVDEYLKKYS